MPTTERDNDKRRRAPHDPETGRPGSEQEPRIPDDKSADLDDDQADSGPDRDHKELGG